MGPGIAAPEPVPFCSIYTIASEQCNNTGDQHMFGVDDSSDSERRKAKEEIWIEAKPNCAMSSLCTLSWVGNPGLS